MVLGRTWSRYIGLLVISVETRRLIEPNDRIVFAAGHEHDLVAPARPSRAHGVRQNGVTPASISVIGVRDHVFDQCVGPAAPREIGNDDKRTAGDKRAVLVTTEAEEVRAGEKLAPYGLYDSGFWQWLVFAVQVSIELQKRRQVDVT